MPILVRVSGLEAAKGFAHRLATLPSELGSPLGELVEAQIRTRIDVEKASPTGAPWAQRLPATIRRARGKDALERSGRLLASVRSTATSSGAVIGSALPYARRQDRRRPFIGLSAANLDELRAFILRRAEVAS